MTDHDQWKLGNGEKAPTLEDCALCEERFYSDELVERVLNDGVGAICTHCEHSLETCTSCGTVDVAAAMYHRQAGDEESAVCEDCFKVLYPIRGRSPQPVVIPPFPWGELAHDMVAFMFAATAIVLAFWLWHGALCPGG